LLHEPADRDFQSLVLFAGQFHLLGDHPRLHWLILLAQHMGEHERLELASGGRSPFRLLLGRRFVAVIFEFGSLIAARIQLILMLVLISGIVGGEHIIFFWIHHSYSLQNPPACCC
jgi:hypothetical protein